MKRRTYWATIVLITITSCSVNPAERNNAGISFYDQGEFEEALRAYQAAQVTSPDASEPYFNAAGTFVQLGKLKEARAALEQVLKAQEGDLTAKAYYNLGNIYFELALYEQAVDAYRQTLLQDPDDNDARYNLELALSRIVPPSATPLPQDTDPQVTPTDDGNIQTTQTPTLAPQNAEATVQATILTPSVDNLSPALASTMSADEAARLLNSIQQDQGALQDNLASQSAVEAEPEKDW